jgi:hypothetical protein
VGYDAARTHFLQSKGMRVIRFWNSDLVENFEGVLESLHREVLRRNASPCKGEVAALAAGGGPIAVASVSPVSVVSDIARKL